MTAWQSQMNKTYYTETTLKRGCLGPQEKNMCYNGLRYICTTVVQNR